MIARVDVDPARVARLVERGVVVRTVAACDDGVGIDAALRELDGLGIRTLLVEGGGRVITSLLRRRVVDRLIVSISPRVIGSGVSAVGDLGTGLIRDGIALTGQQMFSAGEDMLFAADPVYADASDAAPAEIGRPQPAGVHAG